MIPTPKIEIITKWMILRNNTSDVLLELAYIYCHTQTHTRIILAYLINTPNYLLYKPLFTKYNNNNNMHICKYLVNPLALLLIPEN